MGRHLAEPVNWVMILMVFRDILAATLLCRSGRLARSLS
jgi:hypothetical protein